jgi:TP901 family phage tail tape measure protein
MTDIGKLTYSLALDTSRFNNQLKSFSRRAEKYGSKAGRGFGDEFTDGAKKEVGKLGNVMQGVLQGVGQGAFMALSSALAGVGSAMTGTIGGAYQLEKSMKTIQGKAQASQKEIDSLKSSIISLSGNSAKTAQEIATAGEKMAQFGFSTKETEEVMKGIAQTSTATGESMEKVARALNSATQGFDEYNKSQEDAIKLGDRFTAIANNANVTIENLRMGLSKYSAVANDANQSFKDTAAAFAVLRDNGIQAEQAGTTVRVVLQRLQSPSKKAREAMSELGVEVRNAEGKMKSLPKMLEEFDKALQDVGKEKSDLLLKQIFGSQGLTGFKALMSEAEGRYKELRKTIEDSQNVAAETAKTMRTEWESFQSTVDALGKRIGTSILPVINSVLGLINDIYAGIKKVDISFKPITKAVEALGVGFQVSEDSAKSLGKSIGQNINSGIQTAANLIQRVQQFWESNKSTIKTVGRFIKNGVQGAIDNVVSVVEKLQGFWDENKDTIKEIRDTVANKVKTVIVSVVNTVSSWIDKLKDVRSSLVANEGMLNSIWNLIQSGYEAWQAVWDVVQLVGTAVKVVAENVGRFINLIAKAITGTDNTADAWSKVSEWIQAAIDWVADVISNTSNLVSLVADGLTSAWQTAGEWLQNAWDWVDKQVNRAGELVSTVGDSLAGAWESVSGWIDGVLDKLGNIWDTVTNIVDQVKNGIGNAIDSVKGALSGVFQKAVSAAPQWAKPAIQWMVENLPIGSGYGVGGTAKGLDNASAHLKPLLGIAKQTGVGVTSGLRPGDTTASGNLSYHAKGSALDFSGTPEQMKAFAHEVARRFGDQIHSIIYSGAPGAQRYKGQPHQFGQPIKKNHWDHVHVTAKQGQLSLGGQGSGYGVGGKESVPDPRDNQEFKDAFKAATGKEFSDYEESPVTEAKRKLEREKQSDLKNDAQDITKRSKELEGKIERLNKQINDLQAARATKMEKGGDYQDDKDFTARIEKLKKYRDEQKKLLEVEKELADVKMSDLVGDALEKGTQYVHNFSDKLNELNREFSDLSKEEQLQNKLKDINDRFDEMRSTISSLIEEQEKILEVNPGNQQAQRTLEALKQQRQELQKERAEALKYTRNKHQEQVQQEKEQQRKERREKALEVVGSYNQNRLDAFSRQRGLNKSLMDAQMQGVEGEYRRSQANYNLERRKLRMETQSRISDVRSNPDLSESERENMVSQLERLEQIKLKNLQDQVKTLGEDLNNAFTGAVQEGLKGLIMGTKSLGEALTGVLDKLTEFALNKAFQGLFGGGLGTGGAGVLDAALGVASGGLFGGMGNPLTNSDPMKTLSLGFASGGLVPDVNSGKRNQKGDSVPAMLTPGEYVLNRQDTSKLFGQGAISANEVAGFSGGGKVSKAGSGGDAFYYSPTYQVSQTDNTDKGKLHMLRKNIDSTVKQILVNEQRPGGLLNS